MDLFERLQRKPPHVKAQVAFGTALSVTLVIAFVWSMTLPMRFAPPEETQQATAVSPDSKSSFMSEAKETFGNLFGTFRDAVIIDEPEESSASTSQEMDTRQREANTLDLEAARQRGGTVTEVEWGHSTGTDPSASSSTEAGYLETENDTAATGAPKTVEQDEPQTREPRVILIGTTSAERVDDPDE